MNSIAGSNLTPVKGQLYEIKKHCGRLMGVAEFLSSNSMEELRLTEFYFKPLRWYIPFTSPKLILRMNHRGAGSYAGLLFTAIEASDLPNYIKLLEIKQEREERWK